MQTSFKIPFKFKGDPVATAKVQGVEIKRCVLDTGAANSVMRLPISETPFKFDVGPTGVAAIKSFSVEKIEFGPLQYELGLTARATSSLDKIIGMGMGALGFQLNIPTPTKGEIDNFRLYMRGYPNEYAH